jgi:hypothetical protein
VIGDIHDEIRCHLRVEIKEPGTSRNAGKSQWVLMMYLLFRGRPVSHSPRGARWVCGCGGGGVQVVLTRSHELYAIGRNTEGQLGMGDVEQQPTPKPVVPPLASVRTSTLGSLD